MPFLIILGRGRIGGIRLNLIEKIKQFSGNSVSIPDCVWFCEDLKPTDIKLYKVLLDYGKLAYELEHGKITEEGFPIVSVSQDTLASKVGVSDRTIQTCLKRLEKVGLVKVESNRGYKKNNLIILVDSFYEIHASKTSGEDGRRGLRIVEKEIKRVPIKRVPIKIDKKKISYMEKLRELGGMTYTEKAILSISRHYDMLASRFNHLSGYRSLSKRNPQSHKNWKFFERVFYLCRERGWDANLYLEAQFDRARKYWKNNKIKFPLPNMLASEKAIAYFEKFLKDRQEKYQYDLKYKELMRGQKTKTVKQRLIEDIIRTAEYLSMYVREDGDGREREEDKAIRIYHSWESYSPAYLWTIPWFHEFIKELEIAEPDNEKVKEVLAEFEMINRNKKLQEVIKKTVEVVEREYNLPKNIAL